MDNILKASAAAEEYHMEMTEMLNQFDSLPNLGNHEYQDLYNNLSEIEFSGGSPSSTESTPPPKFHNSFINSSPVPPVQETMSHQFVTPNTPTFHTPQSMERSNSMDSMREMMFQMAAMQPIEIDPESVKPPQRRNVKISKDPQSIAARHRRERISEKIRILQRLVPGGTKMDTASMLDEAVHYIKFLKKQVQTLEKSGGVNLRPIGTIGYPVPSNMNMNYSGLPRSCQPATNMVGSMQMLS